MSQSKRCSRCKATFDLSHFTKCASNPDGLQYICRSCAKYYRDKNKQKGLAYAREYRAKNRETLLEKKRIQSRDYYKRNKAKVYAKQRENHRPEIGQLKSSIRRARKNKNGVYRVSAQEIKRLRIDSCFYCNRAGGTIDHIIPLSRGGRHSIGNLVGACLTCNLQKGTKLISEWKKVRGW